MAKKFLIILLIFPIFIFSRPLKYSEINPVMDHVFEYHIEYKSLNEKLVQRTFKIYIEQFDSAKIYLLESEVQPYLEMSSKNAKMILHNIKNDDYSDFIKLNELFVTSINRFRSNRPNIQKSLMLNEINGDVKINSSSFAKNVNELEKKQTQAIYRFYQVQKRRSNILDDEKKNRVFALLENKMSRNENRYLNQNESDSATFILKSMTKSLDAHTCFFSEEEAYEMRLALEKEFEGVGLVLTESIDGVVVTDIIKNSPAEKSGKIQVNDVIVEIDGENVQPYAFEDVMKLMKKENSNDIILGFKRASENKEHHLKVRLQRQPISMDEQRLTYSYEQYGDGIIAKLDLKSFYESSNGATSEKDILKALRELRQKGNVRGMVLDLRENSGGFLSQAIKVASLFLSNGVVVISKNFKGDIRYLRNLDPRAFYKGPLIILTSKLTASASEIVAAALQDYGVALVVGDQTTFGKGSIQYQTVTDKNADVFYKVTVGKYYTVSGKGTQIRGVEADIVIPSNYSAYKIGEKYLEYPLENDSVKAAYDDKLSDLEPKIRLWFKQNYLPSLQRKVSFWQKMMPLLKENSLYRQKSDPNMRNYLKKQEYLKAKVEGRKTDINYQDPGVEDLQLQESINILKDMILLEAESRKAAGF